MKDKYKIAEIAARVNLGVAANCYFESAFPSITLVTGFAEDGDDLVAGELLVATVKEECRVGDLRDHLLRSAKFRDVHRNTEVAFSAATTWS